jgi:ATP-dependent helicase/nuclease subunit A
MAKEKQAIKWTAAQRAAIETTGRTVLVTASAGTGKTAVLSHRAVERVCDPADRAQADSLLVLTFTDAAAEEMRGRIAETLRKRYAAERDESLRRQLLLLDRSYISTIHAFCKRILTEFFYLIDLDPTFGILDSDEQRLLKAELLEKTLQQAWDDETLASGLESLFEGRRIQPGTGSFVDRIIPLSEFLDSVVSRDAFYARASALNDSQGAACEELKAMQQAILLEKLALCEARLGYAMQFDAQHCGGGYASDYIAGTLLPVVEQCRTLLEAGRFDLCAAHAADLDLGRMPAFKKKLWDEAVKDLIKKPIDAVKDELKTLADAALLCVDYETVLAPQVSLQTTVLLGLLRKFDANYAAVKAARNMLDFADLEHAMLRLLESRPEAADKLRERFDHVFVDEYQDINAVQQRIIERLSRNDNVFVVGDIKQSIYGFRQSKPDIFLSQLDSAKAIAEASDAPGRVDLQDNFRCRREVIDFVNALFGAVMTKAVADMDYDSSARLKSGFPYPPFSANDSAGHPVELAILDEDDIESDPADSDSQSAGTTENISAVQRQAAFIAQRIRQIVGAASGTAEFAVYDKKTDAYRPVEYRDIVILMRSLSHKAQDYVEMLRLAGVPVSSQSACGYFEATEISDCLCLLKVLDNADRDIELAALLRSPIFGVTDSQLAAIRLYADEHSKSEDRHSKRVRFYQAVLAYAQDGPDTALRSRLSEILGELHDWRRQVRQGSPADLLDRVFREKRLLSFYSALPNGAQRRANLLKLHDHAIHFEHFRTTEPGAALGRFVEFLEKLAETEQDWAPAEPDSSSENAVRIMSVHKSKGLEFPVVFVAELNTPFNRRSQSGECLIDEETVGLQVIDRTSRGRFASMAHQVIAEKQKHADLAEEMRILYVALTRAREKLILTASRKEAPCATLLAECAGSGAALEDWKAAEAGCHLDWLLMGLAGNAALCGLFGLEGRDSETLFAAMRIGREELDGLTGAILEAKKSLTSETTPPQPGTEAAVKAQAAFETIRDNLVWEYPYEAVTHIRAKMSVSELTHRDDEFAMPDVSRAFARKPAALIEAQRGGRADALSLGSAVHMVLEHLDLTKSVDAAAVERTIGRLSQDSLLDAATAGQIDTAGIPAFFESVPGRLAQAAGATVLREWPFTYGLKADDDEIVVLQGIVDMIIPTGNGLVIVDFKTDRVTEAAVEQRAAQYAEQLRAYARAAGDILNQPVTAAWLYFLTPRKAVEVNI